METLLKIFLQDNLPRLNSSASVTLARKHGIRRTRDDKARQFTHHPAGSGPGMHFMPS